MVHSDSVLISCTLLLPWPRLQAPMFVQVFALQQPHTRSFPTDNHACSDGASQTTSRVLLLRKGGDCGEEKDGFPLSLEMYQWEPCHFAFLTS